jgi:hypothetical protein
MRNPVKTVFFVASLVAAVSFAAGCSDGGSHNADRPGATPSETAKSTTTGPPTSTPTTAVPAPDLFFPSGQEAMDHLVQAWKTGNRPEALRGAAADTVDALLAVPSDGYAPYNQCGTAEFGQQLCAYRNRGHGGFIQFQMDQEPQGWTVTSVMVDPGG